MKRIWKSLDSPAKGAFFAAVVLSALGGASGVVLLGLSGWFLTASALAGFAGSGFAFNHLYPSAGVRLAAFVRVSARYGEQIIGHDAILRFSSSLRADLFERGARARRGLAPMAAGELSILIDDVEAVEAGFLRVVSPSVSIAMGALAAIAVALMADASAGLLAFGVFAASAVWMPYCAARRSRAAAQQVAVMTELARARVARLVENAAELDVVGALPAQCEEAEDALRRVQQERDRIERPFRGLGAYIAFAGAAVGLLCLARAEAHSVALATGAALALIAAFDAASAMTKVLDAAPHAQESSRRLDKRLDAHTVPLEPDAPAPLESVLPLQAVGLAVAAADDAADIAVPDFTLKAGTLLEVTGRSGAGKTTLAETLMHLHPIRAGVLTYAGREFGAVRTAGVLAHIAMSPQLADFLPRTLRAQLLLAKPDATDAAILTALDMACVGDAVRARTLGLDTRVDAEGGGFSGGELRRIAIARALMCEPEVLILDEPFAGLEAALSARLIDNLASWAKNGRRALIVLRHEADLQSWPHLERETIVIPAIRH